MTLEQIHKEIRDQFAAETDDAIASMLYQAMLGVANAMFARKELEEQQMYTLYERDD